MTLEGVVSLYDFVLGEKTLSWERPLAERLYALVEAVLSKLVPVEEQFTDLFTVGNTRRQWAQDFAKH